MLTSWPMDMPITAGVDQVLNHDLGVDEAIARLPAHPCDFDRITSRVS